MGTHTSRITRSGDLTVAAAFNWAVSAGTGTNPVNAADFPGGVFPSGIATVPANATYVDVTFTSNPDTAVETDETGLFTVTSSQTGVTVAASPQAFTITNDDVASGNIFGPADTSSTGTLATGSDVYTVSFECVSSATAMQHFNIVNCDADGSGLGTRFTPASGGYSVELVSIDGSNSVTQVHNGTQFTQAVTAGRRLETGVDAQQNIVVREDGVVVKTYAGYVNFQGAATKRRARFYSPAGVGKNVKIVAGA